MARLSQMGLSQAHIHSYTQTTTSFFPTISFLFIVKVDSLDKK